MRVVRFPVSGQARRVGKALRTLPATVRPLASVGAFVDVQSAGLDERLRTHAALIVLSAAVNALMPLEVGLAIEALHIDVDELRLAKSSQQTLLYSIGSNRYKVE